MSEQLLPGYIIRSGSGLDRALLVKFMQRAYQQMFPEQNFAHLGLTVEQYFSQNTPLWWVFLEDAKMGRHPDTEKEKVPASSSPIACLWAGNAIDQVSGDRHTHIFLLYVMPEHRRRGVGKALMQYVENWAAARGDKQIALQVFAANTPALNLYNQLGYQTQSLWMVKPLHPEQQIGGWL